MANWWGLLASCQVSVRGHKEKTPNKQTHWKSTHWKWGLSYCLIVLLMLLRASVSVCRVVVDVMRAALNVVKPIKCPCCICPVHICF